MKIRKKKGIKIVVVIAIILLGAIFVLPIPCSPSPWMPVAIFILSRQAQLMRTRLLCKTDHQALLEACRELLRKVETGELNTGFYTVRGSIFSPRIPEASQFPQVILDIQPRDVFIRRDGYVTLEMHGGIDHFGVHAYPDDFKEPFKGFKYGDREIIPGLWYYDEDYVYNPEYDKRIEALLQKVK